MSRTRVRTRRYFVSDVHAKKKNDPANAGLSMRLLLFLKDVVGRLEPNSGYPWVYRSVRSSIAPITLVSL